MYKLISYKEDEPTFTKIRQLHGTEYEVPPIIEIWKEGHLGLMSSYTPIAIEYRQLFKDRCKHWPFGDAPCAYGHYFFFHNNTGTAYLWTGSQNRVNDGYAWYLVGCQHKETVRQNIGNCLNNYTCKQCGYVEQVDSSD